MSIGRALFVLPASFALVVAGALPAATADAPPGYNPRVEAHVSPGGPDSVASWGWYADPTVDVAVNGGVVAADHSGGDFAVPTALAPGDVVTVTGDVTGVVKTLTVADHQLTTADIPADTATGTATPAPESDFVVWAASPSSPHVTPSYDPATHVWVADFGAYDLQAGQGIQVRQDDTDGDGTLTMLPVLNPIVEIWDTHGVAASGWVPGSTLTLTLDDPTDGEGPLVQQVTADGQGSYWDVVPEAWQPLQPGWVATMSGAVPQRETPTITKTLVLPDPIPMPDVTGTVVSDTVTGTLTDQDVGAGGRVSVIGWCAGGSQQGTTRGTTTDPVTGAFSLDLSLPPVPPVDGFGDICAGPIENTLYRLHDADGDMFQAWWLPELEPALSLQPDVVVPGDEAFVTGTGWDLGTVTLVQCRLAGGTPDFPDGCDWSTRVDVLTSPGEGWPYAASELDASVVPVTLLDTAGGPVDVTAAGASAIVAFEPWRDGPPMAWAEVAFAATLDVEGLARGTVSTVTGSATVHGTVSASAPVWVHLSGELRQRFSRTRVVVGWFDTWVYVEQPGTPTAWSLVVAPQTGQAFGGGKAELTVWADQGDEGGGGDMDVVTVSLTAKKR